MRLLEDFEECLKEKNMSSNAKFSIKYSTKSYGLWDKATVTWFLYKDNLCFQGHVT